LSGLQALPLPSDDPCNTVARKTNGNPNARIMRYGRAAVKSDALGIPASFSNGSLNLIIDAVHTVPNITANAEALLTTLSLKSTLLLASSTAFESFILYTLSGGLLATKLVVPADRKKNVKKAN
jgi:hypothetical protein